MVLSRYGVVRLVRRVGIMYLVLLMAGYMFMISAIGVKAISQDLGYEVNTISENVNWCGGGPADGRTYCRRNCTSYVAYKLWAAGVDVGHYTHNGNGKDWADRARAKGISTGTTPKIGAVAYWTTGGGGYGHVGWVDVVNSDGSVNTSNYNGLTESFYTQDSARPEGYIYFSNTTQVAGGVGSAQFLGRDSLQSGNIMKPNQYILSGDIRNVLILQKDGNLVLYGPGYKAVWNTKTNGQSISHLVMQSDGNLVLYRTNGSVAWASYSQGNKGARLIMQKDGNLVVYNAANKAVWNTSTFTGPSPIFLGTNRLSANTSMYKNQYIRSSDKRYVVILQPDGNLVLYSPGYKALWNSGTANTGSHRTVMQSDGNLVVYNKTGNAIWNTAKFNTTNPYLIIQPDGNLVTYGGNNGYWSTGTNGKI